MIRYFVHIYYYESEPFELLSTNPTALSWFEIDYFDAIYVETLIIYFNK